MSNDKASYFEKQLAYIKIMGKNVIEENYFGLFPLDWYTSEDYRLKEEILDEAILKKCLIINTNLYGLTMQEGIIDLALIKD